MTGDAPSLAGASSIDNESESNMINFPHVAAPAAQLPAAGDDPAPTLPTGTQSVVTSHGGGSVTTTPFASLGDPPIAASGRLHTMPPPIAQNAIVSGASPESRAARHGIIIIGGRQNPSPPPIVPVETSVQHVDAQTRASQAGIIIIGGRG